MSSHMVPAHPELPEPGHACAALLASFDLHLRAERKSPKTIVTYLGAARLLARWTRGTQRDGLATLTRADLKTYVVWMIEHARSRTGKPYSPGYVNNQYRALQQFFVWLAHEEDVPNPMSGMKAPKVDVPVVPVLADDHVASLLATVEKAKDHDSRRDAAIMRLFLCSGLRLSELTMLKCGDIDLANACALVTGKGGKQRVIKFDLKTASAIDRYLRVRAKHKLAQLDRLWLASMKRNALTPNGIRQMIRRRARSVDLKIHPHIFRHNFSHRWLDAGGAEGDLMELNGWSSPQMLRRYGASARSARAQRAYDRIDVMGGM